MWKIFGEETNLCDLPRWHVAPDADYFCLQSRRFKTSFFEQLFPGADTRRSVRNGPRGSTFSRDLVVN